MADEKRPYRMKKRAVLEEQTRRRITESTVELHGSIGPARTSISAIAERAGVRRSTVYRHFPDEAALFAACSSHYRATNPPPDVSRWVAIGDPAERLRSALDELYPYYRRSERMLVNLLRDEATMPIIERLLGLGYRTFISDAADTLMKGRRVRGRARNRAGAAIGHAVAFTTWRSLAREQGLGDEEAAALMCSLVECTE
jgi:AcrR family transcriptional regulator